MNIQANPLIKGIELNGFCITPADSAAAQYAYDLELKGAIIHTGTVDLAGSDGLRWEAGPLWFEVVYGRDYVVSLVMALHGGPKMQEYGKAWLERHGIDTSRAALAERYKSWQLTQHVLV